MSKTELIGEGLRRQALPCFRATTPWISGQSGGPLKTVTLEMLPGEQRMIANAISMLMAAGCGRWRPPSHLARLRREDNEMSSNPALRIEHTVHTESNNSGQLSWGAEEL